MPMRQAKAAEGYVPTKSMANIGASASNSLTLSHIGFGTRVC